MPEQPCAFHPDRLTRVTCTQCERPICPEDMIPAPVGNQCPVCAGRMRDTTIGQASYRVRTAAERTPLGRMLGRSSVTQVLLGANILVFLVLFAGGLSESILVRMGALRVLCLPGEGCLLRSADWWRMFTAMFVHIHLFHILFNMWALTAFGPAIETRYGKARFLALYLISGLLGSASSIAFTGGLGVSLRAGASGAIFGILGAWIAFFFRHRNVAGARSQLQSLLFLVGINLFFGFAFQGIDNSAHVGGLVGGFAIGTVLEGSARLRSGTRELAGLAGYVAVLVTAVALTLPHTVGV